MNHARVVYDRKQRAWSLWCQWARVQLRAEYPDTDGSEHLIHNWYRCSPDPQVRRRAERAIARTWKRWRRIDNRYKRLYDRSEHNDHVSEGRAGAYLWCDGCKAQAQS